VGGLQTQSADDIPVNETRPGGEYNDQPDREKKTGQGYEVGLTRWEEQNKTEQLSLTRVGQLEFRRYVRV
jgi:hypothetical protein